MALPLTSGPRITAYVAEVSLCESTQCCTLACICCFYSDFL